MTVDDAGRRAGASLRDRFDRSPAPPLPALPGRRRSGRTAVLAGIAAVLVVALVVVIVAPRGDETSPGHPGGTWKRVDARDAFGRDAHPTLITRWQGRLLALGHRAVPNAQPPRARPAVWTSDDGEHWDRIEIDHAPRQFFGFASLAVHENVIVASIASNGQIWRSTDARNWRRVVDRPLHRSGNYAITRRPGNFVAVDSGPLGSSVALISPDGRRWRERRGTVDGDRAIGLHGGARLGDELITMGQRGIPSGMPTVYRSRDGVRWTRSKDAGPPARLGLPLVSNHARTLVLGIDYDPFPEFGGRLVSTRDGVRWTEIRSFHEQMPVGNPDHLIQVRKWWVLGGNTGVPSDAPQGERRASMWSTPDLRRWYEMPTRLRGVKESGAAVRLTRHDGRVVGLSHAFGADDRQRTQLWIWTPPD